MLRKSYAYLRPMNPSIIRSFPLLDVPLVRRHWPFVRTKCLLSPDVFTTRLHREDVSVELKKQVQLKFMSKSYAGRNRMQKYS